MQDRPYVRDHAQRFAKSINLIAERRNKITSALDIAGNDVSQHLLAHFLGIKDYQQTPIGFDIEKDSWEGLFRDSSFDLIVLTEVIEHLGADPAKVIHWCNKLLKDDGLLLVSTPNMSRTLGLYNLIHGRAPYHWGVLFGSEQDRHQREYAPWELAELVAVHGFEVQLLTSDVYEKFEAHSIAEQWVAANFNESQSALRGDSIFICASKVEVSEKPEWIGPIYDGSVAVARNEEMLRRMSRITLLNEDTETKA
jgi:SAM-dependent methyltransferase